MEADREGVPLTPERVASAEFALSLRGYNPQEVRAYLQSVSSALRAAQGGVSVDDLRTRLREAQAEIEQLQNRLAEVDARKIDLGELTESELIERLGDETSRILRSAHDAAAGIVRQAEQRAEAIVAEATADVDRVAQQAEADAVRRIGEADRHALKLRAEADDIKRAAQAQVETDLAAAKERGRLLITQARVKRDQVEADIEAAKARHAAQLDQFELGRARIAEAYDAVAQALIHAGVDVPEFEPPRPQTETPAVPDEAADEVADEAPDEAAGEAPEPVPGVPDQDPLAVDSEVRGGLEAFISTSEPDTDEVGARVDQLFEQIRQERAVAASRPGPGASEPAEGAGAGPKDGGAVPAPEDAAPEDAAPEDAAPEPEEPVDPAVAAARARLDSLHPAEDQLVKVLKRTLADEQNAVLERLRELDGAEVDTGTLVDLDADQVRYGSAVAPHIEAAALAGAASVDRADVDSDALAAGTRAITDALAGELARSLFQGVGQALEGAGDPDQQAERIRGVYRQWRVQRLAEMARHYAIAAFNRAVYDAVDAGTVLAWSPDPDGPVSPSCEPNIGVTTTKGEKFPSGHLLPPTVAGCRCQLTLAS